MSKDSNTIPKKKSVAFNAAWDSVIGAIYGGILHTGVEHTVLRASQIFGNTPADALLSNDRKLTFGLYAALGAALNGYRGYLTTKNHNARVDKLEQQKAEWSARVSEGDLAKPEAGDRQV